MTKDNEYRSIGIIIMKTVKSVDDILILSKCKSGSHSTEWHLMMLRILKMKPVYELLTNDSPLSLLLVLEDLVDPVPEL